MTTDCRRGSVGATSKERMNDEVKISWEINRRRFIVAEDAPSLMNPPPSREASQVISDHCLLLSPL